MKILHLAVLLILSSFFLSGCAVYHSYGPYKGKLIDEQTEEPIEGAAVLFTFWTEGIYATSKCADAVEKITDRNGEFTINEHFVFIFPRLFHGWDKKASVIIFKPGYSVFDFNGDKFESNNSKQNSGCNVLKLTKLNNMEERRLNTRKLYISDKVPKRKYKKLRELKKMEMDIIFNKSK